MGPPETTLVFDTGEGHVLAAEASGAPDGRPVVLLHGGPGSGRSASAQALFDPSRWRVIALDQRGCGASRPHAGETTAALRANTTRHLVADLERLRLRLGFARWTLYGSSWGATLALAYAAAHPERVEAVLLGAVTTTSAAEVAWITEGVGRFLPEAYAAFRAAVPEARRATDVLEAYRRRLVDPEPTVHAAAARAWADWEIALGGPGPAHPRWDDARFRLGFARLVTHYWARRAWLAEGALLRAAAGFGAIPCVLVQGRLDLAGPPDTAHALARAWPGARLEIVDAGGHDTRAEAMRAPLCAAIAWLETQPLRPSSVASAP